MRLSLGRLVVPSLVAVAALVAVTPVSAEYEVPAVLVEHFPAAVSAPPDWTPRLEARFAAKFDVVAQGRARSIYDVTTQQAHRLEADDVRERAVARQAQYVVVGQWADSPEGVAGLDALIELRSGHSGAAEHRYRFHWDASRPTPEAIDAELERVALAMVDDLGVIPAPAAVASAADHAKPEPELEPETGKRTDFLSVSRDEPIEINSEDLELRAMGETKHLIFRRDVVVVQGELRMYAGHLEAFYPKGASQPDRLDAREAVRVVEGDLEVRCREATYLRDEELVICRGDALLLQGCDEVRGREIEFHIVEERVEVKGAASVVLRLDSENGSSCEPRSAG
ncbi:MAG: hypothetical protein GY733_02470 [bacterium]|nr:hypothetical protein [bacterium]